MTESREIDTLSLISIQHELAMNIGLNPQLIPMVRRVMRICLRRLSVRRIYLFIRAEESERFTTETVPGPEGSFYISMPADQQGDILEIPQLNHWISAFYRREVRSNNITNFQHQRRFFHVYPLAQIGILILERVDTPLPEILIGALRPVFDRLRQGCESAMKHEQIIHEVERRRVAERRIEHLAFHDDLTGLPNRRYLLKHVKQVIKGARGEPCFNALIYLGLDHFSDINESLGYQIGDAVLLKIAERAFVPFNIDSAAARLDGDEFGVLVTRLAINEKEARDDAVKQTRSLLSEIEESCEVSNRIVRVSASAGIVLFKGDNAKPEEVLSHGRSALRRAKALGRNTIHLHEESMYAEVEQRLSLDYEMRTALENGEFQLWLQPQVNGEGSIIGAETLIRWFHPEKGMIAPDAFIPMAEKSGFIVPLSDWVLNQACMLVKELDAYSSLPEGVQLAVNLSAKQFHQPDFVSRVLATIEHSAIAPERIDLELTESTLLGNVEEAIEKMRKLKEAGLHISIDDFGTGYSSLAYLRRLPINRVKIDHTFVSHIDTNPDDQALVEVIISIAKHFNMSVIAEGIERPEALEVLKQMGCQQFQGYLLHEPMPYMSFLDLQ
jgi:diguanylate cyclase (GGDEF)-like protein